MAPSPRKNLSATTVVFLLLVIVTTEMASVGADTCKHLSGNYHGLCDTSYTPCEDTCKAESKDNTGGACFDSPPRCYCFTNC
ncbi:hypothetical protein SETIT_3G341500v2 [Setaria italica]|uniref:Knottins-like domain-containing protein n=2 Tax=Setaria TaxID=4554 RepID=A0A368QLS3_SETIT|nr:hypothetical protein SETIT_3G341500v2 [Setaria italica]TKW28860.1 hypothetical protein SEVIR_3G356400v2 [Setaria viridis]